MTADIVTRLHDMGGSWYFCGDGAKVLTDAAAEIERLRSGGCARDQRETQYCAEAATLAARIEELKGGFEGGCHLCEVVAEKNKILKLERDSARCTICVLLTHGGLAEAKAKAIDLGWDCYKETT